MNDDIKLAIYVDDDENKKVITILNYKQFLIDKDKKAIADFIYGRLHSRYINPFEEHGSTNPRKNGFSMMANYCLLIETLQSFKNGWGDSRYKSEEAFKQFFSDNPDFAELEGKGAVIYRYIRCGILHQGETTEGWRITREGKKLLNEKDRLIDAYIFGQRMTSNLNRYRESLKASGWDSEKWCKFRVKMEKIVANTKIK